MTSTTTVNRLSEHEGQSVTLRGWLHNTKHEDEAVTEQRIIDALTAYDAAADVSVEDVARAMCEAMYGDTTVQELEIIGAHAAMCAMETTKETP